MVYCIVEGVTDSVIMSAILNEQNHLGVKIIFSGGFPTMPAVARTIMSSMEKGDKAMIVCDRDNFQAGRYGRDMLGFLLRGAVNNPAFALFAFSPNIDKLVADPGENKSWKKDPEELSRRIEGRMERILQDETVMKIIEFAKK